MAALWDGQVCLTSALALQLRPQRVHSSGLLPIVKEQLSPTFITQSFGAILTLISHNPEVKFMFLERGAAPPPSVFSEIAWLRPQISRAILGRCTKAPVSARGFRETIAAEGSAPRVCCVRQVAAGTHPPPTSLLPLPDGPRAGCHSSRHGALPPLPWCCLALLTGGL